MVRAGGEAFLFDFFAFFQLQETLNFNEHFVLVHDSVFGEAEPFEETVEEGDVEFLVLDGVGLEEVEDGLAIEVRELSRVELL